MSTAVEASDRTASGDSGSGFCFAHLSDPHLTSLHNIRRRDLINKRVLGYLSWRSHRREEHRREVLDALLEDLHGQSVDHTVITGDLTHLGLPAECIEAHAWLSRLGSPEAVTVIPGNHDMYVRDRWQHTLAHWVPYMKSDGVENSLDSQDVVFPSLRVRGPVAFIGLSSAYPSAPLLATGRIGQRQLDSLDRMLEQALADGLIRVLLVHHPPVNRVVGRRKRLKDAAALREIIGHRGVELILHGHSHRSTLQMLETTRGAVPVIGVPSASGVGLKPGRRAQYHLHRFGSSPAGRVLEIEVRGYEPNQGSFVRESERSLPLAGADHAPEQRYRL